jgi:hypothetical protein
VLFWDHGERDRIVNQTSGERRRIQGKAGGRRPFDAGCWKCFGLAVYDFLTPRVKSAVCSGAVYSIFPII